MNIRRTILASILAFTTLACIAVPASARATRELVTAFGAFGDPTGLAVDQETGNVYVADEKADTVDVFGAAGGAPAGGAPSQITGLNFKEGFPAGVAVDNSCYEHEPRLTGQACEEYDPSYGDLYVVSTEFPHEFLEKFKLNSEDKYELVKEIPAGEPLGVTVDSQGNVYVVGYFTLTVTEFRKDVKKVLNGGKEEIEETLEEISIPENILGLEGQAHPGYVAVDDSGDVYASNRFESQGTSEGNKGVAKLEVDPAGKVISEEALAGVIGDIRRPVTVDRATGNVYVGDGSEIAEYDSAGVPQLEFGSTEALGGALGKTSVSTPSAIAVNGETERIYVANPSSDDVDVFGPVIGPPVVEGRQPEPSSITRTSVLVAGMVNPESGQTGNYRIEYVDAGEYEQAATDPYGNGGRTAESALPPGHAAAAIERVVLTGLRPGTTYHYRIVATNAAGTTYGPDETFTTAAATPPVVSTGPAGEVTATSARLTGAVGPRGLPTSYAFEVGADISYTGAKLFGSAGASTGEDAVTADLQYLVPGTTYHYRLVATSFDGTSFGQDMTFTTPAVAAPISQPSTAALIASPTIQFPSIAGAITKPQSAGKTKRKQRARSERPARSRKRVQDKKRSPKKHTKGGGKGK
jgi:DNA-binding beta-propeller fold protein YncE